MDLNDPHRSPCGEDVASYALGALSSDDAARFEDHMAGCELCQTDLDSLRPVVRALPETPDQIDPPPELRRRLMAVVEQEAAVRRRASAPARAERSWAAWLPRPVPTLAAAGVLLIAGMGVGLAVRSGDPTITRKVAVAGGGQAVLSVHDGGGKLVVHGVNPPPRGHVLQVWLVHDNGDPEPTDALFTPDRNHNAHVAVPGDMDGVTRVMVSEEPAGGSPSPTTAPSIDFRVKDA